MTWGPTLAIATAPKRDSRHWKAETITWEQVCAWVETPAKKKEAGNYLFGTLKPDTTVVHKRGEDPCGPHLHRRKDFVVSRSAITLDVDKPEPDFADKVELLFPHAGIMHTTHSSTPDEPRYRMIIPTDREMAPDEYVLACLAVMEEFGKDQFDPGTTQPERYMFRPAAQKPEWFESWVFDGELLVVDDLLDGFEVDLSTKALPKPGRNKRDPFKIDGAIGAFNTAYADWDLLISTYELPYTKVDEDRYQLAGARSQAGMGPVQGVEGFVYSHHANDPAYGKTCSAFDLVRLHLFGDLDEEASPQTPVNKLPSHVAMLELATTDTLVVSQIWDTMDLSSADVMEDERPAETGSNSWKSGLLLTPRTAQFRDHIHNWDLVRKNDPVFGLLYFNELSLSPESSADLPWRAVTERSRVFEHTDRDEMGFHLERTYGIRPPKALLDSLINTTAVQRRVNPVRDYLEELVWDQEDRLETCLPGVRSTAYNRMVARKVMIAAVARMFDPGCKWDHTLVLYGDEGLGKSWWIDRISRGYSASLGRIGDKDTLISMQRSWIMVSDEGHSLRKGDADEQKEFLTRTSDLIRLPYDREMKVYPRHCVIWSTTNDETFLRRQEGNRRFLIVHCEDKVDFDSMTDEYVDQLWAEAVFHYRSGEQLYLGETESQVAAQERERFVEEDVLAGLIGEYLNTLVPEDWWFKSSEARATWIRDRANGFEPEGTERITRTCSAQIWEEALGRKKGEARRTDLLDISNSLKRIGWVSTGLNHLPGYGTQTVFVRKDDIL